MDQAIRADRFRKVLGWRGPCLLVAMASAVTACTMEQPNGGGPTPDVAIRSAATAAKMTEKERTAVLDRAEAALGAGEYQVAFEWFSQVLRSEPNNPRALVGMGESYLAIRDPGKALPIFERVEREVPDKQAVALQGQGLALLMLGRREESQKRLLEAVKMNPGLWRAWNAIGANYDGKRDWTDALASYDKATAANPTAATVINNKGMSLFMQDRDKEAEAEFQKALELDPRSPVIRNNLRLTWAWQGKYDQALAGLSKEEMPAGLNNVGYIAMARGDYSAAKQFLQQAVDTSPSYYEKAAKNLVYLNYLMEVSKSQSAASGKRP